jgi:hypothetical protein
MKWTFHQKRTEAKLAPTLSTTLTTLSRQFSWEPLRTFPFDRLPKELQLRVWELSRDEPRIIPLEAGCRKEENGDGSIKEIMDCVALVKTPTILHVCRDYREIGLKIYKLRFEASLRHPIYFDSKVRINMFIKLLIPFLSVLCTVNTFQKTVLYSSQERITVKKQMLTIHNLV